MFVKYCSPFFGSVTIGDLSMSQHIHCMCELWKYHLNKGSILIGGPVPCYLSERNNAQNVPESNAFALGNSTGTESMNPFETCWDQKNPQFSVSAVWNLKPTCIPRPRILPRHTVFLGLLTNMPFSSPANPDMQLGQDTPKLDKTFFSASWCITADCYFSRNDSQTHSNTRLHGCH